MKLPRIIKKILIETYLDLQNLETSGDASKINLENLLSEIHNGKNKINILESSLLFEFFYYGYETFLNSHNIDDKRLESDTLNYYDELRHQFYDYIDFQSLDRDNPTTLQIMSDSIYCENFILIDWVKRNFNIFYMGNEVGK